MIGDWWGLDHFWNKSSVLSIVYSRKWWKAKNLLHHIANNFKRQVMWQLK